MLAEWRRLEVEREEEASRAEAAAGMAKFEDIEGLTQLMNHYHPEKNPDGLGAGDHPALIEVFARIGKWTANDTFPTSNKGAVRSKADILYPSQET